ncbi:YggS family pyridoxal phosphate-dependent enzyme [candidate division KSB1 bacterium]|nr:YggS family pyridoxal phosphate-dependent enzyme [candidate division KSB1 bacterium]
MCSELAEADLSRNYQLVLDKIRSACRSAGRQTDSVTLVAATKNFPGDVARKAYALGIRHFGENRVQEAVEKYEDSKSFGGDFCPVLHLIGHLQSNKVRRAAKLFQAVDTVDSVELGQKLNQEVSRLRVLVEVNTSGEPQKYGVRPDKTLALANDLLNDCPNLELAGLMAVGPQTDDQGRIRASFRQLRTLWEDVARELKPPDWTTLSMGMSGDFELAIAEGATEVRLGSILFGPRPAPQV